MRDKNRLLGLLIHLIGWGMVFGFPLFFTPKDGNPLTWERYLGYVGVPVTFVIVFYLNYFLLIDKLLFRKQLFRFILSNLLLFVLLGFCLDFWQGFYFEHFVTELPEKRKVPPKSMLLVRDGMMMLLTAALSMAIRMTENWYILENEKKELEKARTEAELQNLKSQLNPHFLFNTLNNIYSLVAISPERAQYAVHNLSKLLRHVLYQDAQHLVALDQELVFMKSYIDLMSLRLTGNVDLQVHLPEHTSGIQVAPLLFITLVENAFKHGTSAQYPSFIHVGFSLASGQEIRCRIENSYFPKQETDRSGSGIGLDNLRKRLELLYAGRYRLTTGREGDRYVAELKLIGRYDTELSGC